MRDDLPAREPARGRGRCPYLQSSTNPGASSRRSAKMTANTASTAMSPDIILVFSHVMSVLRLDEVVNNSGAVERAMHEEESDERGVMAFRWKGSVQVVRERRRS